MKARPSTEITPIPHDATTRRDPTEALTDKQIITLRRYLAGHLVAALRLGSRHWRAVPDPDADQPDTARPHTTTRTYRLLGAGHSVTGPTMRHHLLTIAPAALLPTPDGPTHLGERYLILSDTRYQIALEQLALDGHYCGTCHGFNRELCCHLATAYAYPGRLWIVGGDRVRLNHAVAPEIGQIALELLAASRIARKS